MRRNLKIHLNWIAYWLLFQYDVYKCSKCMYLVFYLKKPINDNLNMYINDHLRMYTSDYALI